MREREREKRGIEESYPVPPLLLSKRTRADKRGKREEPFYYMWKRACMSVPVCLLACVCVICLPIRDLCARRSKLRKKKKKRKGKLSLSWYLRARSLARLMCLVYPILFFSSPVVHMLHTQFTLSRTDYKNGPLK